MADTAPTDKPLASDATLRDWFATYALMGLVTHGRGINQETARLAYRLAEFMLKERELQP